jgi:(S)-2-hydroxyglutarate dehydrogenase
MSPRHDVTVVGGGIVGLATAYRLLERKPALRVAVVEKEGMLASHQSGRNSGVLHSGLYYTPGSLKGRLCTEGRARMERFADEHGIPYRRCGKVIVAVDPSELGRLKTLKERGQANGVVGLAEVGPERLRELEPHAAGIRALHAPSTGVIDFQRVAVALGSEIGGRGGQILLGRRITGIERRTGEVILHTDGDHLVSGGVINCAGLQSDRIAAMDGVREDHRIIPFRGRYHALSPEARSLVRGLIYPVPHPSLPFLGVHFTRRIDGQVWVGPNALLALAREGYRGWKVDFRDAVDLFGYSGFWRMARRHLHVGLSEIWRDVWKTALLRECRRYLPELRQEHVRSGPSGIRAQAVTHDGSLVDDFVLNEGPRVIHVRNAPSPAATASLAIGDVLAAKVIHNFGIE